jgi:hypothetical protein
MLPVKQKQQTADVIQPTDILEDSEKTLTAKIDSEMEQLLENFLDLIKLASVNNCNQKKNQRQLMFLLNRLVLKTNTQWRKTSFKSSAKRPTL